MTTHVTIWLIANGVLGMLCLLYAIALAVGLARSAGLKSDMADMGVSMVDLSGHERRQKLIYALLAAVMFGATAGCVWYQRGLLAILPQCLALIFGFLLLRQISPRLKGYDPLDSRTY